MGIEHRLDRRPQLGAHLFDALRHHDVRHLGKTNALQNALFYRTHHFTPSHDAFMTTRQCTLSSRYALLHAHDATAVNLVPRQT